MRRSGVPSRGVDFGFSALTMTTRRKKPAVKKPKARSVPPLAEIPIMPAVAITPVSDVEKHLAALKLQEVPAAEHMTHILARISRQEHEEIRAAEERAEERIAEAVRLHPEQDVLVLATSGFHFDCFRRKVGPRPGRMVCVDRDGDALRGHRRKHGRWLLITLPGFDRMFHTRPYNEREMLSRALFAYNS